MLTGIFVLIISNRFIPATTGQTFTTMRSFHLKEFFYYTRLERNAVLTLIVLCLVFFFAPLIYPFLFPPKPAYDFSEIRAAAAAIAEKDSESEEEPRFQQERSSTEGNSSSVELFSFDPNQIGKDDWIRLGIHPRTARTILNYRSKGGKFYKKEDMLKVFGFREEDYERLENYIVINSGRPFYSNSEDKTRDSLFSISSNEHDEDGSVLKKRGVSELIDINKATQEDWQQLRGIGPAFSKRIVNFREKLGGFANLEQVGETYGLPDSTFQKILPLLKISPVFRKINLNTATLEELKSHPYLNHLHATVLFNYRMQHGKFKSWEEVKKATVGLKESNWSRLEPYLTIE